ncbi:glycosyltransferase [Thalassobium sp. R2A62]|uniref:glycosyltransferase n=1 Tax=Thalassobium sp. R2A62 TaxID=633131 RepID=UPI0001B1D3C9|nr:glycosyltransferase [Thalassobium sp. R2A62]EET48932.1 rb106 [Thalassobium sp. R2A62]
MTASRLLDIQTFMWPAKPDSSDIKLVMKQSGDVALTHVQDVQIGPEGEADFGTWFNLFNLGTWQSRCQLQSLFLRIEGEGPCQLTIRREDASGAVDAKTHVLTLSAGAAQCVDVGDFLVPREDGSPLKGLGVLSCRVQRHDDAAPLHIRHMAWATADVLKRRPDMTLVMTTFKREDAVERAVKRFEAYRAQSPLRGHLRMFVVDNGQSIDPQRASGTVEVLPNPNLGGAGGFTRGFLEARDRGASHVLFMDDDASIYMDSLERTWSFLAFAKDERTAISGAMSTERHPWLMWEYGALFFKNCIRQLGDADLRNWREVIDIEHEVADDMPDHLYAGWWYFAFPVKAAQHLAFPFFVRGDDVSFSLVNDFDIVRLNGVLSYQASFIEKESPQTWYLDLRSHLAHHLSIERMDIGRWSLAAIAAKFFLKNLVKMHYDTASAVNLAVEDVLNGPEFFVAHVDMAQRRADLNALTDAEVWTDFDPEQPVPPRQRVLKSKLFRFAMKLCLNGHLVPGFRFLGPKRSVVGDDRGALGIYWGVSEMTILSANEDKLYQVRHSKPRAFREGVRMLRNLVRLVWGYSALKRDYQSAYPAMTSEAFWRGLLDQRMLPEEKADPSGRA